ncbi:ABC transporter permease subunit [Geobacillus stearothermophilus]|uniref:carbohydrate ABC transporter permease n=1 Tax=Geobacillus stearothermophilus TaxID=1422 RepID=UPI000B10EB2E|nr:ABC transporter permease subunit [Geobacillus stearothermophilus]MED3770224.1 ABC transporter permease subunit [Geobacillus stearothermophilus]MED3771838.1 ABC transporter permease subunit [Geobacillus stearothermophilus]
MRNEKRMERLLGYSLVAPAMLLILAIAIWPVIQSFYYSLFNYRLNDPTKSSIHWSYSLDLEGYLQNYPFLKSALKQEMAAADGQTKQTLAQIEQKLAKVDAAIRSNDQVAKQYDKVKEMLDNFETPSDELKIAELDKQTAERLTDTVDDVVKTLKEMKKAGELQQADKVVGLAEGLEGVVIEPNFVGLKHYKDSFSDMRLWKALWNTTFFTVVSVAIELVLGFGIALLINKAFFGRGLVRATILIPWAIPTAVSALMWKFLYDGQNGIVAHYFETIGLVDRMGDLLTTEAGAMFAVIFADVWKTTPYMALLLLAGLQTIPNSLYEAALIDGATKWQQFTQITLPLLNCLC